MNLNLWLLAFAQGLFLTNNVTFIAINGLVGWSIAPLGWMATLPVVGYVVGGALSTGMVAKTQKKYGRKMSFQLGLVVGMLSAAVCAYAAHTQQFWLLVASTMVAGFYNANASLYRFAAAELALPAFKEKAVSLVMAGGLLGAVLGPNLAQWTKSIFAVPFVGAYTALVFIALLSMLVISRIQFPELPKDQKNQATADLGRPLAEIVKQPIFIVAALASSLGYGVMNLLMAATPLAMQNYIGVLLNFVCIAIALSGQELHQYLIALFLLGLGWNFLFTGGTTLALTTYQPVEKDRAQGAINFITFAVLAFTSFASGAMVTTQGWSMLNTLSLLPVFVIGLALIWLAIRHPKGHNIPS
ncbi:MAG: MFS transporter [Polaromonas sp.]|nr:MFS transporter [Polaromonas sp.]